MQNTHNNTTNLSPSQAALIRSNPPVNMTLKEAAAYAACSPRKLRDLVLARRVKSARIGTKIVINRKWVDAFLGLEASSNHAGR